MVPVVSFVGNSGVGKTTFLEKLIPVLKDRGYRIASIKHDVHNFTIDYPGKDSWRLTQAGSDIVVLSAATKLAILETVEEERRLAQVIGRRVHEVGGDAGAEEGAAAGLEIIAARRPVDLGHGRLLPRAVESKSVRRRIPRAKPSPENGRAGLLSSSGAARRYPGQFPRRKRVESAARFGQSAALHAACA